MLIRSNKLTLCSDGPDALRPPVFDLFLQEVWITAQRNTRLHNPQVSPEAQRWSSPLMRRHSGVVYLVKTDEFTHHHNPSMPPL